MTPEEIAADLYRRGCRLYHAINLPDFRTYVDQRALLSREQLSLTTSGIGTPFVSDASDEERGLLDRCFGNLADLGERFWRYDLAPPNVYGPITLVFSPDVFRLAIDSAVTRTNAGSKGFDLSTARITLEDDWARLFANANSSTLGRGCLFSEFSTSTNKLPFALLEHIIVEPMTFDNVELVEKVTAVAGEFASLVVERQQVPLANKKLILDGLAQWCADRGGTPPRYTDTDAPPGLITWYKSARPQAAVFRWFQYTVTTLTDMSPDAVSEPVPPPPRCDTCGEMAHKLCSGCSRWLCYPDYYGFPGSDGEHDARAQGRCSDCCFDPT